VSARFVADRATTNTRRAISSSNELFGPQTSVRVESVPARHVRPVGERCQLDILCAALRQSSTIVRKQGNWHIQLICAKPWTRHSRSDLHVSADIFVKVSASSLVSRPVSETHLKCTFVATF
jgi:hypothetical protein